MPKGIRRSDAEKRRAVKMLRNRGDRTITSVAAECGVTPAILHYWAARMDAKEPLTPPLDPPPAPPSDAVTVAVRPAVLARQTEATSSPRLSAVERDELILLRDENRRLRRMLAASMMIDADVRGTAWDRGRGR